MSKKRRDSFHTLMEFFRKTEDSEEIRKSVLKELLAKGIYIDSADYSSIV